MAMNEHRQIMENFAALHPELRNQDVKSLLPKARLLFRKKRVYIGGYSTARAEGYAKTKDNFLIVTAKMPPGQRGAAKQPKVFDPKTNEVHMIFMLDFEAALPRLTPLNVSRTGRLTIGGSPAELVIV